MDKETIVLPQNHPEKQEDEYFVYNTFATLISKSAWETKRRGMIAYNNVGTVIPHCVPVFVKIWEFEKVYGVGQVPILQI